MTDKPSDAQPRRSFFKRIAIVPLAASATGGALLGQGVAMSPGGSGTAVAAAQTPEPPYTPTFFNAEEWAFVIAACDRLIPKDEHGPGAVELGVPEFLDRHMQTPYAAGNIWYTQGPYTESSTYFGYQGRLVLRDILRVGIKAMNARSAADFSGRQFAQLETRQQEDLLKQAEAGKLKWEDVPDKIFFNSLLTEVRNGYFADPKHGGNKGMGAWKMIGYPGMRADYVDWVEVRDKPYPIGPVDLAGRRA
ncbi:gluconate 2-dehydrogenase subunit 3 family protein [Roseateles sp. YR242]|uniref:gluconate 2-dehydrogenase subunit 3 family protein n=1 Tax=Roseateles sp. YR242 TaxID=1855305 RepID=UPI000B832E33|nr:gluconate 2-dehydrogenase subunit 3 family protein [Roseateles sp. YR242]